MAVATTTSAFVGGKARHFARTLQTTLNLFFLEPKTN
jgi:hypothetical protein